MPRSLTARTLPFASLAFGALSVMLASGPTAGAATTTTVAIPTAFCTQVKTSQTAIAGATGATKLTAIAAQWSKIESAAPATIKGSVDVIRTAYEAAAKARNEAPVKTPDVTAAGKAVTTFYTQRCGNYTRPVDNGGPDGDGPGDGGGPGRGFDNTAFEAYRACLAKNGLNLPAPGANRPANGATPTTVRGKAAAAPTQINPSDPKVIAAMAACKTLLPAGANGGVGGFGGPNGGRGGRGGFGAIQACLQKKGVTLQGGFGRRNGANGANGAPPAGGANGAPPAAGGQAPQLDAKTQAAIDACRKEAAATAPTTTLKKV